MRAEYHLVSRVQINFDHIHNCGLAIKIIESGPVKFLQSARGITLEPLLETFTVVKARQVDSLTVLLGTRHELIDVLDAASTS